MSKAHSLHSPRRLPCIGLIVCVPGAILAQSIVGEVHAADALTAAEYFSFSTKDQRDLLIAAVQARQSSLANIQCVSETREYVAAYNDGDVGALIWESHRQKDTMSQIGDSYYLKSEVVGAAKTGLHWVNHCGFDSPTGIARMFVVHDDLKKPYGRITRQHDPYMEGFRYGRLLSGWIGDSRPSYLEDLLRNRDEVNISDTPDANGLIIVSLKPQELGPKVIGQRFWLDPTKGFMLMRWKSPRVVRSRAGESTSADRIMQVRASREVDGVWLPEDARLINQAYDDPQNATVYDMKLISARMNKLVPKDLMFSFPPGTVVSDMISVDAYAVSSDGSTHPVKTPYRRGAAFPPKSTMRGGLLLLNVIIVAALCIAVVVYRLKSTR